jgi:hypothetical protein
MSLDLERLLYETEDFLRRAVAAPSAREAKKRRWRRKVEEFGRRMRRAFYLLAALLVGLVAYSIFVAPIGFLTWMVAIPTAFLLASLMLFRPTRRIPTEPVGTAPPQSVPLDELAARAEEGLLDRCNELPGRALPAANRIMAGLNELQPHLGLLEPVSPVAGDARRLIGQHLPRLVDSFLALPERDRRPGSESIQRFTESLDIVAGELDSLLSQASRDQKSSFDTNHRFIETRYRDQG